MIRRPPRSTRTDTSFPTRRSSDLLDKQRFLFRLQLRKQPLLFLFKLFLTLAQRRQDHLVGRLVGCARQWRGGMAGGGVSSSVDLVLGQQFGFYRRRFSACVYQYHFKRAGLARGRRRGGKTNGQNRGMDAKRSEEHTSELQSLMRFSYAVFSLTTKTNTQ